MPKIKLNKKISELNELNKLSENNLFISDNIIFSDKIESNLDKIDKIESNLDKIDKIDKIESNLDNIQEQTYMLDIITINDFKKKEKMLYEVLNNFFITCTYQEIKMMIDIINGNHSISLRFLDWFVTRYCYLYKLSIGINNINNKEQNFNINISYKAQLKSFKKKYFDPFRRKKKFLYVYDKFNLSILTTLGQLNFFRWALNYDIIKYVEINYKTINNKIAHVNSYFKKNTVDINSLSISSNSDENTDSKSKQTSDSELLEISDNKSSDINNEFLQTDINFILGLDDSSKIMLSSYKQNKSNIIKDIKKSQSNYKYPQVSRNICIEF